MRKLIISLLFLIPILALQAQNIKGINRRTTGTLTFAERKSVDQGIDQSNANYTLKATLASPTFTGTVTAPILSVTGAASFTGGISLTATVTEYTTIVTVDSTKIEGNDVGDIGHADGAILVAAPGTGYTTEFVSAFLIYERVAADFAGGNNDLAIQVGVNSAQVAMSGAITDANFLTASSDKMIRLGATATEVVYADNGIISLAGTAFTNNSGTAAGMLRVHVTYRVHTTGL